MFSQKQYFVIFTIVFFIINLHWIAIIFIIKFMFNKHFTKMSYIIYKNIMFFER